MTIISKRRIVQTALLLTALLVLLAMPLSVQAAEPAVSLTAYPVAVEEKVTGDVPESQNTFVFKLTPVSQNAPIPTNGTELSITGSGSKNFTLDLSNAPLGDVYEYTVEQQTVTADNYTKDTAVFKVSIYIVKNSDNVVSPVTVINRTDAKYDSCQFTNQYTAPVVVKPTPSSPFTGLTENTGLMLLVAAITAAGVMLVIAKRTKASE